MNPFGRQLFPWTIWATMACGSTMAGCGDDRDPLPSTPDAGGTRAMPPSRGTVPPLDVAALVEGNRGFACTSAAIDERVDAWMAAMTLEQKVLQMHGLQGQPIDGLYHAGGDASLGIPPFKMVDGPRGVRAGNATAFPVGMARGATWDPELERRVGMAIGLETAAKGGNVLLAPTINLLRHPGWGRAQETYSEDPFHMGRMAVGFIGGVQNHVLASAKHFAVNSVENTRFTMSANLDERTLREVYLPHFREAVEVAAVASVMSAYNRVNGTYCAENPHLLRDILKGDWGFAGFVESDWFAGTRSTVASALAGLDIEMPAPNFYGPELVAAARAGDVPEGVIDEAVRRILRQKACFSLDEPASVSPDVVESEAHRALAREVAERSMVLLKNDGRVLPLAAEGVGQIAVVGALSTVANLGDRGSSSVTPSRTVSPLEGIEDKLDPSRILSIATDEPTEAELAALEHVDVALVVAGLTYEHEGEFIPVEQFEGLERGGDRASLELPEGQVALIRAVAAHAPRTVVVLEAGSAVLVRSWVDDVDALLMAWYPGMEGGAALASLLFGERSPSGRLPLSWPRAESDLPPWDITSEEVAYGFLHGYRLLDQREAEPEFPFGFGLGYSHTVLGRLALDREQASAGETVTVSIDVHNAGERSMDEVVQIYASAPETTIERAPRVLVGFSHVSLEPGEVKTVHIAIDVTRALSHWDTEAGDWALERTTYALGVGRSSRDLPFRAMLTVD